MRLLLRHALVALVALVAAGAARAEPGQAWGVAQVGWGRGGWTFARGASWFEEALARDPLRVSWALEGSGELCARTQAGLRLSGLYLGSGEGSTRTRLLVTRLEAVANWRPLERGPYARLGTGPAGLWYDARVPSLASGRLTAGGWSASVAAGVFWPVGERIELRVEAEGSGQAWLGSGGGPSKSWILAGSAGVAWR
jgi:hypothetical protein